MVLRMKRNFISEVLSYIKVVDREHADRERCAAPVEKKQEHLSLGDAGHQCSSFKVWMLCDSPDMSMGEA